MGDYGGAESPYLEAVWAAERAANDALIARSAARLAFVLGDKLTRMHEADGFGHLAEAALSRLGGSDDVEGDILSARLVLFVTEGHPADALPMSEKLIAIRERTLGEMHLSTAKAINNYGYALQMVGEPARAVPQHEHALAIRQAILGPKDPGLAIDYSNLGSSHLGLGKLPEAIDYLKKAVDLAESGNPNSFWAAWALQYLSVAETRAGDPSEGRAAAQRGLAILDRLSGESRRLRPPLLVGLGEALLAKGDAQGALEACSKARALQDESTLKPEKVYEWDALACVGDAELARGHAREAIAPLSLSATLTTRVVKGTLARAKLLLARALVETHGDAAKAKELAKAAHDELAAASSPYDKALLAKADALAARGGP